jgi:hypothetical protein
MARWMLLGLFSLTGLFGSLPAVILAGCRKEAPPQPYVRSIDLEALDASCTEAWLRVRFTDSAAPRAFALKRDGQTILSALNSPPDTLLIDEGLLPNRTYGYKAYRFADSRLVDSTAQVTLTTMDTTSHNFTWHIDTLGDGGGSVLYDVAIINDTLAYAVGEIYKRDSLGNWDPLRYNLAKWNGQRWELKRVTVNFRGNLITPPLYGIYAFSGTDIWIAAGMAIHGNESNWVGHDVRALTGVDSLSFTKCWGVNSTDMYFVGLAGFIAHYDGVRWRRIESGTTLDVYDIYGSRNLRTGETEIYAVAAKQFVTFDRRILRVRSSGVEAVSDSTIPYSLHGVWLKGGGPYYVVGSGIYRKRDPMRAGPWQWLHPGVTPYYTYAIRGNDVNDVFICGSYGELLHFNGIQFRSYQNTPGFSAIEFYEVSCRNNLVVAVGYVQPRAVAVRGRRTP